MRFNQPRIVALVIALAVGGFGFVAFLVLNATLWFILTTLLFANILSSSKLLENKLISSRPIWMSSWNAH